MNNFKQNKIYFFSKTCLFELFEQAGEEKTEPQGTATEMRNGKKRETPKKSLGKQTEE